MTSMRNCAFSTFPAVMPPERPVGIFLAFTVYEVATRVEDLQTHLDRHAMRGSTK